MLHTGDTQRLFSRDLTTGLFMPQAGVMTTLIEAAGGTWILRSADGHAYTFDADGYLSRDEDRFGNAFGLEWESNAWGKVFDAICPQAPSQLNQSGQYVDVDGPTGAYNSGMEHCVLLAGLTGRGRPIGINAATTFQVNLPANASQALIDARDLLVELQTAAGRGVGSGSPWGQRFKRLLRVTDTEKRQLVFEYYPDTNRTPVSPRSTVYQAGLLKAVTGPAGARVEFAYGAPPAHPVHLNEIFLTSATRVDSKSSSVVGLSRTPTRAQVFKYAWNVNTTSQTHLDQARERYGEFLDAFLNCTFHGLNSCGQRTMAGFTLHPTGPDIEVHVSGIMSDIADISFKSKRRGDRVRNTLRNKPVLA